MLSKTKIAFILSLREKKFREEEKLYVIEGDKMVREFLTSGARIRMLVAKPEFLNSLPPVTRQVIPEVIPVSYDELKKVSTLKTPHNAMAVVEMDEKEFDPEELNTSLNVALDTVQDPGNLGTIIRAAAWFGISNIFCSPDCVDVYNPKVIQASMGAILRVNVFYCDLLSFLQSVSARHLRIFGAVMNGNPVWSYDLDNNGIILLGNESKGISDELIPLVTDRIMIPGKAKKGAGIDSLNVSMAASVIFSEFSRRQG
ncbi:MAG: RNA methyltransferase [Bacteroidales bacterium]|nr:RNA methyltransferase [Bacteroidales bacterium]MBN2633731.1 RNA methyltransferase [Bacteroidales bacterium]